MLPYPQVQKYQWYHENRIKLLSVEKYICKPQPSLYTEVPYDGIPIYMVYIISLTITVLFSILHNKSNM